MSKIEYDKDAVMTFIDGHFGEYTYDNRGQLHLMCPFCNGGQHEERSFYINLDSGVANCYRANKCAFKGTVIFMIKEYLACDWNTAYEIGGGVAPESIDEILGMLNQAKGAFTALDLGYDFAYQDRVLVMPRGAVPVEESEQFDAVMDWLYYVRGYDPDEFLYSHTLLSVPGQERFSGRVLFKVESDNNYAYQAYTYDKELAFEFDQNLGIKDVKDVRKTLNPPGEVLSKLLYNYNWVKRASTVFITEGIFDAARVMEHGFHPVCIFGVNISSQQALLLSDLPADEIVVCLDAGTEKVGMKVIEMLNRFCGAKKLSLMNIDVPNADPDNLAYEDFERCFLRRRSVIRTQDSIEMLSKLEA
jgi:hypothetical protein